LGITRSKINVTHPWPEHLVQLFIPFLVVVLLQNSFYCKFEIFEKETSLN